MPRSEFNPFLNKAITSAVFQSGNSPESNDLSNKDHNVDRHKHALLVSLRHFDHLTLEFNFIPGVDVPEKVSDYL